MGLLQNGQRIDQWYATKSSGGETTEGNIMRRIEKIIDAQPTQDGSGVKIHRLAGDRLHQLLDPYLMIDEINEKVHIIRGNNQSEIKFKNELQSSLTTKIVHDILESDNCNLPTLEESSYAHHELFSIFNKHIKKISGEDRELCPIT